MKQADFLHMASGFLEKCLNTKYKSLQSGATSMAVDVFYFFFIVSVCQCVCVWCVFVPVCVCVEYVCVFLLKVINLFIHFFLPSGRFKGGKISFEKSVYCVIQTWDETRKNGLL